MGTTEENLNLDTVLWFKRVKRPSRLVLPRNALRTSPTKKKESYSIDSPDTQEHDQRNNNNNNHNNGNRYLYSLLLKINIKSKHKSLGCLK